MNTWGNNRIRLSIFGESHGEGVGIVIDGLPPGFEPDMTFVQGEMARRAPGNNEYSTPRREGDRVKILSGLFNGRTTGAPLCGFIENTDTRSKDYSPNILRPSHADYPAYVKYKGFADYRGGGHFSGRLTAPLVLAGALAKQILLERGITVAARIFAIGGVKDGPCPSQDLPDLPDKSFPVRDRSAGERMKAVIAQAKADYDSVGGIIECAVIGTPVGLGEPFFGSMESAISGLVFSVPAVKGIEFGTGFGLSEIRGSAANDGLELRDNKITLRSNSNGGINGGITNGADIVFRVAVKPTATIGVEQRTVDITAKKNVSQRLTGRHDPCIVPRAVVVIESAAALCVLDGLLD